MVRLDLCPREALESDLWDFLQHLTSLRSLKLTHTVMLVGTWHSLLLKVRESLQLIDAELMQLRSILDVEELVVRVLGDDVEAWVCGDISDPFEHMFGDDAENFEK